MSGNGSGRNRWRRSAWRLVISEFIAPAELSRSFTSRRLAAMRRQSTKLKRSRGTGIKLMYGETERELAGFPIVKIFEGRTNINEFGIPRRPERTSVAAAGRRFDYLWLSGPDPKRPVEGAAP